MYEKLVSYAVKQLELTPDEITPESTFESLGIDSLDIVEMIMDLESDLGVELEIEDQKIATFQELADFIESMNVSDQEIKNLKLRGVRAEDIRKLLVDTYL